MSQVKWECWFSAINELRSKCDEFLQNCKTLEERVDCERACNLLSSEENERIKALHN